MHYPEGDVQAGAGCVLSFGSKSAGSVAASVFLTFREANFEGLELRGTEAVFGE